MKIFECAAIGIILIGHFANYLGIFAILSLPAILMIKGGENNPFSVPFVMCLYAIIGVMILTHKNRRIKAAN